MIHIKLYYDFESVINLLKLSEITPMDFICGIQSTD